MKKQEFVKQLAEFCEFEQPGINTDTKLKSLEKYDSMAIMSMIAFIDENFNRKITASQILELTDFNSVIDLIGKDKFEND